MFQVQRFNSFQTLNIELYTHLRGKIITPRKPRSKPRSERAQERKSPLTHKVLAYKVALFSRLHFTTSICRPPQGTGPLPATGETCSPVVSMGQGSKLNPLPALNIEL